MGAPASGCTVRKLLRKHGLERRKACKKKSLGAHPDRDVQFQDIAQIEAAYLTPGDPVVSIGTNLYRT